jgi:hypothetical protein
LEKGFDGRFKEAIAVGEAASVFKSPLCPSVKGVALTVEGRVQRQKTSRFGVEDEKQSVKEAKGLLVEFGQLAEELVFDWSVFRVIDNGGNEGFDCILDLPTQIFADFLGVRLRFLNGIVKVLSLEGIGTQKRPKQHPRSFAVSRPVSDSGQIYLNPRAHPAFKVQEAQGSAVEQDAEVVRLLPQCSFHHQSGSEPSVVTFRGRVKRSIGCKGSDEQKGFVAINENGVTDFLFALRRLNMLGFIAQPPTQKSSEGLKQVTESCPCLLALGEVFKGVANEKASIPEPPLCRPFVKPLFPSPVRPNQALFWVEKVFREGMPLENDGLHEASLPH